MIDIRLLHHCAHRVLDRAVRKFVVRVLVPDQFEIEVRAVHELLEMCDASCVRDGLGGVVE